MKIRSMVEIAALAALVAPNACLFAGGSPFDTPNGAQTSALEQAGGQPTQSDWRIVQGWRAADKGGTVTGPSAGDIGWLNAQGTDKTATFQEIYASVKANPNQIIDEARNVKFFLVGGFTTQRLKGYMEPIIQRLSALKLDVSTARSDKNGNMAGLNTFGSVAEDAQFLHDQIMAQTSDSRKAVIICHSEGVIDVTSALALYPDLKTRVRAVVAVQGPYGGTPLANDALVDPRVFGLLQKMVKIEKGDVQALKDMSYAVRKAFIAAHPYPAADVPTVSLVSSENIVGNDEFENMTKDFQKGVGAALTVDNVLSAVQLLGHYMWDTYQKVSDGFVTTADEIIPGTMVVQLSNMSHSDTMFDSKVRSGRWFKPAPYESADLAQALVTLVLQESQPIYEQ